VELEEDIKKFNKVKLDLLRMSNCIETCKTNKEKDSYQNICIEYSKQLQALEESIEETYGIHLCCCPTSKK